MGDAADGGEGFAAKTKRLHAEQVVGRGELAGGVVGEGQRQVVGANAVAVVHDGNQLGAPVFDGDVNPGAAGIDTVFEQLFHHAGGPFDHFAGGDFGDDAKRELLNPRLTAFRYHVHGGFISIVIPAR